MAELKMAEKRQDYFAAGTKAVWDVDPDGLVVIRLYLAESPESPVEFHPPQGRGSLCVAVLARSSAIGLSGLW
jgi:Uma2 family endonuclease